MDFMKTCSYSKLKKHFLIFSSRRVSKIKFDFKDNKAQIRGRYEIIFVGNSGDQMCCAIKNFYAYRVGFMFRYGKTEAVLRLLLRVL